MQRVFVLNSEKTPLMPCNPAKARKLLSSKKAAVYKQYPFTIIMKEDVIAPVVQPIEVKLDPGSKTTGMALVGNFQNGSRVLWAANLEHHSQKIKSDLETRASLRRGRRSRNLRYRPARFLNRTKPKGWLPPSLVSRIDNVYHWTRKFISLAPIESIQVETVRFDTQKMENPEISGVEYQRGTLFGYEAKEYLLEKWGRKCAYCGAENTPLEIEHIIPKSRGGSNRISNLTLACTKCNQKKGNKTAAEFGYPKIQAAANKSLKDAAAMNATRYAIGRKLKEFGLPVGFWSGGRTKMNRVRQEYPKQHYIDAVCVGESGASVFLPPSLRPLRVVSMGRGNRQRVPNDKFGFPRRNKQGKLSVKASAKRKFTFQTGDFVKLFIPEGKSKYAGTYFGRVSSSLANGSIEIVSNGQRIGVKHTYYKLVQRGDGYKYDFVI